MNIIDISQDLLKAEVYEGDPMPKAEFIMDMRKGDECNLSTLFTCVHTGTHADFPLHFIEGGKSCEEMSLDSFIGDCCVIEVNEPRIDCEYVERFFPKNSERILIKSKGRAFLTKDAAEYLAKMKIRLLGTDAMSVGSLEDEAGPHISLLKNDIAVLENLKLDDADEGEYFLIAPPVKLGGLEGAPVRAVLIRDFRK